MKKKIFFMFVILFLFSCQKTEDKKNKYLSGIKKLEEKDYVNAENDFLSVDKTVNKDVYKYLLRLYEVTGNKEKAEETLKVIKAQEELIYDIAYEYLFGSRYIKKDPVKSKALFDILFDKGKMMGYLGLAYIYENGEGIEINMKKAKKYYEKTGLNKELNNTIGKNFANYIEGLKYELGIEVPKNMDKAKEKYKKAMEDGNRDAFTRLGYIQIVENKTERHVKNGFSYLEKALNLGDKNALLVLGNIYLDGTTVQKDIKKAKFYYEKGIELKMKEAYGLLAHIELFNSESIVIDYKKIKDLAAEGSKLKDGNSSKILGYLYQKGLGVKKNEGTAEKYYLKAIEEGELRDNLVYWYLGDLYFYGSKRIQNNEKALTNYLIATEFYEASAYEVGIIYENGFGVDVDVEKAKEYYKKASSLVPKAEERYNALMNAPAENTTETEQ